MLLILEPLEKIEGFRQERDRLPLPVEEFCGQLSVSWKAISDDGAVAVGKVDEFVQEVVGFDANSAILLMLPWFESESLQHSKCRLVEFRA